MSLKQIKRRDIKNVQREEDEFFLTQQREAARLRIDGKRQKPLDLIIYLSSSVEKKVSSSVEKWSAEKKVLIIKEKINFDDLLRDINHLDSNDLVLLMEQMLEPFFKFFLPETENTSTISDQFSYSGEIDSEEVYWALIKQILTESVTEKRPADFGGGIAKSIKEELIEMFQSKSLHDLNVLESNVTQKLIKGGDNIDFDYWENVLHSLRIWRAKLQLRTFIDGISFERESLIAEFNENETDHTRIDQPEDGPIREQFKSFMNPLITPTISFEDAHLLVIDVEEDRARLVRLSTRYLIDLI
jgi:hypothetical protein